MLSLPQTPQRSSLLKMLVVLFILAIATVSAVPNYFTGNWAWRQETRLDSLQELKAIQQQGIALPGWQTLEQGKLDMGGHKWSVQAIVPEANAKTATLRESTILMLRPQTKQRDMPQVDWVDIDGAQRWTADQIQSLKFSTPGKHQTVEVNARFLRGWHEKQTYAVVQWYAWRTGGSAAPAAWFWADQWTRLGDRRQTSWVAVSILIPIQPLGEISTVQSQAASLGQLVQSTLINGVL